MAKYSLGKKASHFQQENLGSIRQRSDLNVERNRISYIESLILDRIIPPLNGDDSSLETAFMMLDGGTVDKVVATAAKLFESHRKGVALLLERFKRRYVTQCTSETGNALF